MPDVYDVTIVSRVTVKAQDQEAALRHALWRYHNKEANKPIIVEVKVTKA